MLILFTVVCNILVLTAITRQILKCILSIIFPGNKGSRPLFCLFHLFQLSTVHKGIYIPENQPPLENNPPATPPSQVLRFYSWIWGKLTIKRKKINVWVKSLNKGRRKLVNHLFFIFVPYSQGCKKNCRGSKWSFINQGSVNIQTQTKH